MAEQITLSDALDLIAQCKTDIKSSIQGKGSEIGDDLTLYAQSIDNIQFRSLQFKNNDTGDIQTSFDVTRYNDTADVSVQQYINGETSYPVNTSYTVSGTSISVTKNTPGTNKQVYRCVPTNYGTTILTIEDTVGNVEYPIALHVPAITIYGDYYNTMSGFNTFEFIDYLSVPEWVAEWDTSVQQNPNFTVTFRFTDGNGHDVDAANLTFAITGDLIDAGLVTVTYVVAACFVTFTFTPYYNNDDSQYEYYNGFINIAMSDGTSLGDIAPIHLAGGDDLEPARYNIWEASISFCTVAINPNPAAEGENVTVTVTPDPHNVFESIEAYGPDTHTNISIRNLGNNEYSFTMPGEDVDLSVNCISTGETDPYFSSPVDGATINGTIDSELGEFRWPIEIVGSDCGNFISNDNTSMCVTIDNNDWGVGYTEDYDEATASTIISEVYIACSQAATGTATLTYDDSDTGETCTATFTYDIRDGDR